MPQFANETRRYASLSLKDLVEARDLFHYHLLAKQNVVATALGLYRIRKADPWPGPNERHEPPRDRGRRTLFNSEVRPYSWPCVYVFVDRWEGEARIAHRSPADVVPPAIYLPDGRSVPICVIEAAPYPLERDLAVDVQGLAPRNLLGPGSLLINRDGQGMERVGSAGALVRDASRYYVLTNRHVAGAPGTPIHGLRGNSEPRIGEAADIGLTRQAFSDIYPHFPPTNDRLLMDVGLVTLDDIRDWKTAFPGIAPVGPILDLYDNSLDLSLIGARVVGHGGVTGAIEGEIQGLFYRFKAMGGSDYLSDFLIGPRSQGETDGEAAAEEDPDRPLVVRHGDSGTVLFIARETEPQPDGKTAGPVHHPFALLWGREQVQDDGGASVRPFALATSLSRAMDLLDLDLVEGINRDEPYVWGWVGHYVIGRTLAITTETLPSDKLRDFVVGNLDKLAIEPDAALKNDPHAVPKGGTAPQFVALADVPDNVWKNNVNTIQTPGDDGKLHRHPGPGTRGPNENPNHFADIDLPYKGAATFLQWNLDHTDQPKVRDWLDYFASVKPQYNEWAKLVGKPGDHSNHWGALPFRVRQLFEEMVAAAKARKNARFLAAGGVLIHYLGDACQPLHTSYLANGDPGDVDPATKTPRVDGAHSGYEDEMIEFGWQQGQLKTKLAAEIARQNAAEPIAPIDSGKAAARAVVLLAAATHKTLPPRDIVTKWVQVKGTPKAQRKAAMWAAFGDQTVECMARGSRYLAKVWGGAWEAGGGDTHLDRNFKATETELMALYNDPVGFAPSWALNKYPYTD